MSASDSRQGVSVCRVFRLRIGQNPLAAFFALAYGITWLSSAVATPGLLPIELPAIVRGLGAILWHFGPALAAILVAGATGGTAALGALLSRLRVWRVRARWYLVVLFLPLATRLVVVGLDLLLGGTPPLPFSAKGAPEGNPLLLFVPVFAGVLLQAGLAEEIGWRGLALPRLQARYKALVSSLILGILWAGWHFHPLYWPEMHSVALWYVLGTLPITILFTWVYNSTGGSLLLTVLFHTASNVSDWIVPVVPFLTEVDSRRTYGLFIALNAVIAVAVVTACGPQHLARSTVAPQEEG